MRKTTCAKHTLQARLKNGDVTSRSRGPDSNRSSAKSVYEPVVYLFSISAKMTREFRRASASQKFLAVSGSWRSMAAPICQATTKSGTMMIARCRSSISRFRHRAYIASLCVTAAGLQQVRCRLCAGLAVLDREGRVGPRVCRHGSGCALLPLLRTLVHLLFVPRRLLGVLLGPFLGHDGDGRGRAAGERGPKRKLLWHVGRSTHVSPITRHHRDAQQAEQHSRSRLGVV